MAADAFARAGRWRMPAETVPHRRTWMAFPRPGHTLGSEPAEAEAGYRAWARLAAMIADHEPVSMLVDPAGEEAARALLPSAVERIEAPVAEFWIRDTGPSFVLHDGGTLGAVDWVFTGWGHQSWATWKPDRTTARTVARLAGAEVVSSPLVNEGGGLAVDGTGTALLSRAVQLDPRRNPELGAAQVEEEMRRVLGVKNVLWIDNGLHRDSARLGSPGHVDPVAAFVAPSTLLLHAQPDASHPDAAGMAAIRRSLMAQAEEQGIPLSIVELPAPAQTRDRHGWVGFSYVSHLVLNGAVVAPSFGDPRADDRAREILSGVYPGRQVDQLDAREMLARGGGLHSIALQEPAAG